MIRLTFLALVRSGLWNTPADPALFNGMSAADWGEVYHFARTQALLAITFDGMLSLPSEVRPPRPLYLQWAAQVARIEQSNIRLNAELPEIFMPYREAGLHPVLLKGQGIATYYINPLHRQCGDIDVYIGKEGQPIANSILLRHGAAAEGEASDQACKLLAAQYSYREPPHDLANKQSCRKPVLSAPGKGVASAAIRDAGNQRIPCCPAAGDIQCALYLHARFCPLPEQRYRAAAGLRLGTATGNKTGRHRQSDIGTAFPKGRIASCRKGIRLHRRTPFRIAGTRLAFLHQGNGTCRRSLAG